MIRHIVFWKLKDKTEDGTLLENAAAIKAGLEGLVGKIDGLLNLCLYSEVRDAEALAFYRDHPLHKAVQALVHRSMTERVAFDGEI